MPGKRAAQETTTGRVLAAEISQVLQLFGRTARRRQLYQENNAALKRMMDELTKAFERLLSRSPEISLKVRPETLQFEELTVLEEPNPDDSIPFALYRDGIRRLEISRGLTREELKLLSSAVVQGFRFSGLGDDIVSFLWRYDLEHIHYLVVDTTIIDAAQPAQGAIEIDGPIDMDAQINGVLKTIYGETDDDVGPRSVRVDANDIPAKSIADQLESIDALAPGFHPPRSFAEPPSYGAKMLSDVAQESDRAVTLRGLAWSVRALLSELPNNLSALVSEGLLRGFDDVLIGGDLKSATYVISKVSEHKAQSSAAAWLNEALSDVRLRQVGGALRRAREPDRAVAFFEAAGARTVPSLLRQLPLFHDPERRRLVSELIIKHGVEDVSAVGELLADEQAFVNIEGVYILARLDSASARAMLAESSVHPQPPVRLAFLEHIQRLEESVQQAALVRLLSDEDPQVKMEAAVQLRRFKNKTTALAIKRSITLLKFQEERYAVKAAFLDTYALLNEVWSLRLLTRFVRKADGLLATKHVEEMGVASAVALRHVPAKRAVDCLKKASKSRNKSLKSAALRALKEMDA